VRTSRYVWCPPRSPRSTTRWALSWRPRPLHGESVVSPKDWPSIDQGWSRYRRVPSSDHTTVVPQVPLIRPPPPQLGPPNPRPRPKSTSPPLTGQSRPDACLVRPIVACLEKNLQLAAREAVAIGRHLPPDGLSRPIKLKRSSKNFKQGPSLRQVEEYGRRLQEKLINFSAR